MRLERQSDREVLVNTKGCKGIGGAAFAAMLTVGLTGPGAAEEPVAYEIIDETSILEPLTGKPGDPDQGRATFIDRKLGNCLGCHAVTELEAEPFHGEVGPPLDGVADRYEEGELRLQVVDAKIVNTDTIMPGFYVTDGLHRVAPKFAGKTILTAGQVEDIVAYLKTLTEG